MSEILLCRQPIKANDHVMAVLPLDREQRGDHVLDATIARY
jgi:hypothetical protein